MLVNMDCNKPQQSFGRFYIKYENSSKSLETASDKAKQMLYAYTGNSDLIHRGLNQFIEKANGLKRFHIEFDCDSKSVNIINAGTHSVKQVFRKPLFQTTIPINGVPIYFDPIINSVSRLYTKIFQPYKFLPFNLCNAIKAARKMDKIRGGSSPSFGI